MSVLVRSQPAHRVAPYISLTLFKTIWQYILPGTDNTVTPLQLPRRYSQQS